MQLVNFCIYTYMLLKPFYIVNSGAVQISDIFIIIAFMLLIKIKSNNIEDEKIRLEIKKDIKLLTIFVFCVLFINLIYFIIYNGYGFLLSTLHYIFILIGVYVYSYAFRSKKVIETTNKIMKINILVQLIIYLANLGRIYANVRYMGTFNDPNQFAFFMFLSVAYIYVGSIILNNKMNNIIYYLIVLFLVFESASAGMLMAVAIFYVFLIIIKFRDNIRKVHKLLPKLLISSIIIVPILIIIMYFDIDIFKVIKNDSGEIFALQRIDEKLLKYTKQSDSSNFFQERGYDKIFYYPQYLLFGAGQGKYDRFERAAHMGEIHATIPSIMFYYGIIPSVILFRWIYLNLKKLPFSILIVFVAIFIESFTLLNQRQLLLWTLFVLVNYYKENFKNIMGDK